MSHLYLVVADCPHCESAVQLIEERDEPVDPMQDVGVTADYCPTCGTNVPFFNREWDLKEETRVERVPPVAEVDA